ncbi:kelch-like protein 26 [Pararge aegeria]|uniref:kelch-like protein 26 n=1 Tax=Pararge aegeria TaxID=116150 RepID=UPI0019D165F8|nr:kelch-like protein 26 [Pararge aegeria]
MEEVSLRIGNKVFKVNKELLCTHSDYFRAMFSGYYVESVKKEININMLDPNIASIILQYMHGMIFLTEYPFSTIGEIAVAANFLQITQLIEQIQEFLNSRLCLNNCIEIMLAARYASYKQLEQTSSACGLYSFNFMKLEYITTLKNLVWYLSHPYLDSQNEFHVFHFGFKWLCENHKLDDTLLILACLDMKRITYDNLVDIKKTLSDYVSRLSDSLVLEIIELLLFLTRQKNEISESKVHDLKNQLCEKFSESVWSESLSIIKDSITRLLKYVPLVSCHIRNNEEPEESQQCLYTFDEDKGFEQYLEVADKNLHGWNATTWGLTKLVFVGGEYGRGTGVFFRDIKVYDTLKKKWTLYNVELPSRRNAGVTTAGDLLYIVGGVNEYGMMMDTAIVCDLKERSYRYIANLPDRIETVAICTHNHKVYVAGRYSIYCHETYGDRDFWEMVVGTDSGRIKFLQSYEKYIYCIQSLNRKLYRFRPHIDKELHRIVGFTSASVTVAICNTGNCLMVFAQTECNELTVEEYKDELSDEKPRVLTMKMENLRVNAVAGSCSLIMTMPPVFTDLPQYHKQYLMRQTETF